MKKSSIVLLVVATLLVLFGLGIMVSGALPYQMVRYYGGFTFRYYQSVMDGSQLARMILGGFLFLGGVILFAALAIIHSLSPECAKQTRKPQCKAQTSTQTPKISVKSASAVEVKEIKEEGEEQADK